MGSELGLAEIASEIEKLAPEACGRTIAFPINEKGKVEKNTIQLLEQERSLTETAGIFSKATNLPAYEDKIHKMAKAWTSIGASAKISDVELSSSQVYLSGEFILVKRANRCYFFSLGDDRCLFLVEFNILSEDLEILEPTFRKIPEASEKTIALKKFIYGDIERAELVKLRDYLQSQRTLEERQNSLNLLSVLYKMTNSFRPPDYHIDISSFIAIYEAAKRIEAELSCDVLKFLPDLVKTCKVSKESERVKSISARFSEGIIHNLDLAKTASQDYQFPFYPIAYTFINFYDETDFTDEEKLSIISCAVETLRSESSGELYRKLEQAYREGKGNPPVTAFVNGGERAIPNLWEMRQFGIPQIVTEVSEQTKISSAFILSMLANEGLRGWVVGESNLIKRNELNFYLAHYPLGSYEYFGIDRARMFYNQLVEKGYLKSNYYPFVGKEGATLNELDLLTETAQFRSLKDAIYFQSVLTKYYFDMVEQDTQSLSVPLSSDEFKTRMVFAYYNMGPENGKKFMDYIHKNPKFNFEDYQTWDGWSNKHYQYSNRGFATYRFYQEII